MHANIMIFMVIYQLTLSFLFRYYLSQPQPKTQPQLHDDLDLDTVVDRASSVGSVQEPPLLVEEVDSSVSGSGRCCGRGRSKNKKN